MSNLPSRHSSFNARNYTPKQVAATFVANSDFEELCKNRHTVVLGPRGSGKTTLMKMLTVQALHSWMNERAKTIRWEIPFTAIYVPTDIHWHLQLEYTNHCLVSVPKFSQAASKAAVTTNILLSVCQCFADLLEYELDANPSHEAQLCLSLQREWLLPAAIPSLSLVIHSLKSRIADIRRRVNKVVFEGVNGRRSDEVPDYFHLEYLASIDIACSAFELIYQRDREKKWALCFDELELAPEWLQTALLTEQRSTNERFLFKLSTSPIPTMLGLSDARPRHDFDVIKMWDYPGKSSTDFCERLASAVIKRSTGKSIEPLELFGRSQNTEDEETTEHKEEYSEGSPAWKLIRDVAAWDISLQRLLVDSGISPTNPVTKDVKKRDTILRKIKPVAYHRQAFLKPLGSGELVPRSRKVAAIYSGRDSIYKISDGNPRRLMSILEDLLRRVRISSEGKPQRISDREQAAVISQASLQFAAYVKALPGGVCEVAGATIDLYGLLRAIGSYFYQRLVKEDFPLDPIGSFVVDVPADSPMIQLLRLATYHGAIVHVDPSPGELDSAVRGKRFRLSYMLAPSLKLPLRLYKEISLQSCLRHTPRLRIRRLMAAVRNIHAKSQTELPLLGDET